MKSVISTLFFLIYVFFVLSCTTINKKGTLSLEEVHQKNSVLQGNVNKQMIQNQRMHLSGQMSSVTSMISLAEMRIMSYQQRQGPEKDGLIHAAKSELKMLELQKQGLLTRLNHVEAQLQFAQ